jgi:hypothetical protein
MQANSMPSPTRQDERRGYNLNARLKWNRMDLRALDGICTSKKPLTARSQEARSIDKNFLKLVAITEWRTMSGSRRMQGILALGMS